MLPNTVIIGTPKAGTSSLFYWLAKHPDVCASSIKETYFLHEWHPKLPTYKTAGLKGYERYFEHCKDEQVVLEATPTYLYDDLALKILSEFQTPPQIIVLLRKPSTRIYSRFKAHKYRIGWIDEATSFRDFVKQKGILSERDRFGEIERSYYSKYLARWIEKFGPEKIHIYLFEEMFQEPMQTLKEISGVLNIDTQWWKPEYLTHRNESIKTKSKWLHKLGVRLTPFIPQFLQDMLLPIYMKINAEKVPAALEDDRAVLKELDRKFEEEYKAIEVLTGLNLDLWRKA